MNIKQKLICLTKGHTETWNYPIYLGIFFDEEDNVFYAVTYDDSDAPEIELTTSIEDIILEGRGKSKIAEATSLSELKKKLRKNFKSSW